MTSPKGIALDIDDTLCDTARVVMKTLAQEFPQLASEAIEDLLAKYQQPEKVPTWQMNEVHDRRWKLLTTEEFMYNLPPIPGAQAGVARLAQHLPIRCYISSRLDHLTSVSRRWLRAHGFPDAPLFLRHPDQLAVDWKLPHLAEMGDVCGLVDDNLGAMEIDAQQWPFTLYWYNPYRVPAMVSGLVPFYSWADFTLLHPDNSKTPVDKKLAV
ncbi:MAG TPA: hypothetical protein VD999_02875 [Vitreimonas sp.]|nr:hypothetical protein [Vitreimonas sp.]